MAAPRVFSSRIVCIDYYMSPPIPGVDVLYSSFQGGKVNEVPVIRVYGPTPAGQKTCLHVHKAFPYLYVPISDVKLDAQREGEACANSIALGLEKALKLKGNAGSKRQHIHGHNLVRAKKFYGYHQLEELFVKIYLYYPQDVSRATNLLLGGAVLNKTLQPHESHIPFILQFMIDYNLYGMGHVHLSKMRFRHPVPSMFTGKKFSCNQQQLMCMDPSSWCSANVQADTSAGENFDSPVWVSSAIPDDWTWHVFSKPGVSLAPEFQHVKRQSACELEGDTTIDEIINQQFKSYTSLSQTVSDVKMVQSLIPIWEEEHQRTGIHDTTIPPDPGKPLPKDVLKTFLNSLEFEFKLQELSCRTDAGPLLSDDITRSFRSGSSFSDKKGFADPDNLNCTDTYGRTTVGISDQQIVDTEALGLLRWLATSQASEDINSDDELVRETILSPLLPASTMDKVLEKANIDFESESQKECQDILDSIKDVSEVDHLKEKSTVVCETTPKNQPPLGNDCNLCLSSAGSFSKVDIECETHEQPILLSTSVSHANKSKGKRPLWGSLPLNMKVDDSDDGSSPSGKTEFSLVEGFVGKAMASNEGLGCSTGAGVSESRMVSCSVRDLMRKKRQRRVSEQDNVLVCDRKFVSGAQEQGSHLLSKRLDFHTVGGDDHLEKPVALETFTSNDEDSPSHLSVSESDEQNISINLSEKQHVIVSDCMPSSFSNLEKVLAKSCGQVSGPLYRNSEAGLLTGHDEDSSCMKKPLHSTFPQIKNVHASSLTEELTSPCSPLHKMNDRDPQASLGHFEEKEGVKQNTMQLDYETQQKGLMDLSAHYQNDGSLLYLLTPSLSPPSADCVNEWLLHGCQDTSGEVNAAFSEALVIRGSSKFEAHSSCVDHNDAVVLSSSISDCTPILDEVQQVNDHKSYESFRACNDEETSAQSPENVVKKVATDCSVDVSQISGPDGGSRSTPLSQIGFRDPASVGAGQQLTLLSVEVLAETRADLRPNPRFDAINIISLVFQSDIDSAVEAYVLLRSNASSYHKNLDGVSGYKVLVQSEERSLFDEFVKIINLFDPDIIMGWDVQGGSLGFLAERAAHLGIGLLNGISRTPTEMNKGSEEHKAVDSGIPETGLRESLVSSSPVIGDAVIQDEWGRTHASGVHVGGRVILNIWRLMRSEVRLTMYNIEDVCGTVLRRKIPSIPSKVLSRWFSNGAARYRCIEYLTERAKLNLAIMNQLDMVNRTSELARVFGIEFFSVLSRGSQYRVESMLLRLAHTQNYLAISPGNHQVASQPAMECVPLVMEPESGFYADPVVVLDLQSLDPSMIIAYNLCSRRVLGILYQQNRIY